MPDTQTLEQRIAALEQRVQRLADFNDLLKAHVLSLQDIRRTGSGMAPTVEDLPGWFLALSNEAWQMYKYDKKRF